jgi:hypothetical protein
MMMISNNKMTRHERIEARRAYFAKQEKPFGLCSAPVEVSIEYNVKIEGPSVSSSSWKHDKQEEDTWTSAGTTTTSPPRQYKLGERTRLLQHNADHLPSSLSQSQTQGLMTRSTTAPQRSAEPQKQNTTIYHAISIKNIEGCESREDVYRFVIFHCPYAIKMLYVSELKHHAFVVFFFEEHANEMVKRLDRQPFCNYLLEVQRISMS